MVNLIILISFFLAWHSAVPTALASYIHGENTPKMKFLANVDGKAFFQDVEPAGNWTDGKITCETFGMSLASITSQAQFVALRNAYDFFEFQDWYWTSGRDSSRISQFAWNNTGLVASESYLPFENLDNLPYQTCLVFNSRPNNASFLFPLKCSDKVIGVLCET